jgi:hypothetical protein
MTRPFRSLKPGSPDRPRDISFPLLRPRTPADHPVPSTSRSDCISKGRKRRADDARLLPSRFPLCCSLTSWNPQCKCRPKLVRLIMSLRESPGACLLAELFTLMASPLAASRKPITSSCEHRSDRSDQMTLTPVYKAERTFKSFLRLDLTCTRFISRYVLGPRV